jgi:hypothetical protein
MHKRIKKGKENYQLLSNLVRDENSYMLADSLHYEHVEELLIPATECTQS